MAGAKVDPQEFGPLPVAHLHILVALADGEKHGYAVMREVERMTDGEVTMGPGTLYGAIKRMLSAGLVEETVERPDPDVDDERRRYYRTTGLGVRVLTAETERLERLVRAAHAKQTKQTKQRLRPGLGGRDLNVHERVYRSLLVMYPKAHRREYGEPMVQLVRDRFRDERGGLYTVALWCQIAGDLARTALSERTEITMDALRQGWWRFAASLVSTAMAVGAVGNLFGDWVDDGPNHGKIVASMVSILGAGLVFSGLAVRRRQTGRGSMMIGVGVLPAVTLITVPWFPLLMAFGVLALIIAVVAFVNAAIASTGHPLSTRSDERQ